MDPYIPFVESQSHPTPNQTASQLTFIPVLPHNKKLARMFINTADDVE